LLAADVLEELTRVLITVGNADSASVDADVQTHLEILRHERCLRSVGLDYHLTLQECTLRSSRIDLTGLSNHDRLIFEEVVHDQIADAVVFEAALDDALFEVTEKAKDLLVELDESRLELFLNISLALMVDVDALREGLAAVSFLRLEVGEGWSGQCVEGHLSVLGVSDLFQFDM